MDSFPNPYAALIATFNQVSPLESKDDLDDTQNLPDDDLLLWANAQFTYDIPPGVGIYEDDMGVKLAMSQQQFQHTQQQQQQQQQQQLQFQPQQQQPQSSLAAQQQHALQYQSTDMQRQLQQFDAIHRYLDSTSEDPRTSLAVVERSRQRNPATSTVTSGPAHQPIHYDPRMNVLYPHTSHAESSTSFSAPTTAGPISPAAARLLRQPFLSLQTPHIAHQQQQQQQHQQSQQGPSSAYSVGPSPLPSPTSMSDFHQLQISPLPPITPSKPNDELQALRGGIARKDGGRAGSTSTSSSSNTSTSTSTSSPAVSTSSKKANASAAVSPREEKPSQPDNELYDDDLDLEDQHDPSNEDSNGASSASSKSKILAALEGLSQDDPEYGTRLAAEEDKRRRNTAASARFRHKKRLREQILEKTAKEMTAKSEMLEVRVRELEMEIKWLRGLIVEKDSRSLDVGSTTPTSTVSPAGSLSGSAGESFSNSALNASRAGSKTEGATLSRTASKAKRGKKSQA
ncbi:hypothetical protein BGX24_011911 [Mortierella sp. AD032]|nr:hypothetical protein BGX24_011911 [Mortierella sp. AD032]